MAATSKTARANTNETKPVRDDLSERAKRIRQELSELGEALAGAGALQAGVAREAAENRVNELLESGEQLISEMSRQLWRTEKQVVTAVREKPLQALGIAVAAGFLAAVLMRR